MNRANKDTIKEGLETKEAADSLFEMPEYASVWAKSVEVAEGLMAAAVVEWDVVISAEDEESLAIPNRFCFKSKTVYNFPNDGWRDAITSM